MKTLDLIFFGLKGKINGPKAPVFISSSEVKRRSMMSSPLTTGSTMRLVLAHFLMKACVFTSSGNEEKSITVCVALKRGWLASRDKTKADCASLSASDKHLLRCFMTKRTSTFDSIGPRCCYSPRLYCQYKVDKELCYFVRQREASDHCVW